MDPLVVTAALAGGVLGVLASSVPGLHVNTLAALVLVGAVRGALPAEPLTPFLLGALGASTIANAIPLVLLGVPSGEDAPGLLPGQRLARAGRARDALAASATGSLIGLVAGVALALVLWRALMEERVVSSLPIATLVVALGALAFLVLSDPAGPRRAAIIAALSGALGLVAFEVAAPSPFGLPSSVLLPLFLGLFGLPALLLAAHAEPIDEEQREQGITRTPLAGPLLGASLGGIAGLFAGFTSGPATAVAAHVRRTNDIGLVATTAAVNTAGACAATAVLHALGRARSGVHAAEQFLAPPVGTPDGLLLDLAALAAGCVVAFGALIVAARIAPRLARRVPLVARVLILPLLAMTFALTGWMGLLITAAGYATARASMAAGTRRSLLMAVLLVPAIVGASRVA